jgi:hypothetical protein
MPWMHEFEDAYRAPSWGPLFDQAAGPDPFVPWREGAKPTKDETLIAALIWKHKGRANPISIARLTETTKLGDRQIKGIVEELIVTHRLPIGAKREEPYGFFAIVDAADQETAVKPYRNQILSMLRRLRVLEDSGRLREFMGQIRMELEREQS